MDEQIRAGLAWHFKCFENEQTAERGRYTEAADEAKNATSSTELDRALPRLRVAPTALTHLGYHEGYHLLTGQIEGPSQFENCGQSGLLLTQFQNADVGTAKIRLEPQLLLR